MREFPDEAKGGADRRRFLKSGLVAAGTASVAGGLLANGLTLFGEEHEDEGGCSLNPGDAAMLRFAAVAETLETDFWVQYNELGGIQDSEVPGGSGNPAYTAKLQVLDTDFPEYIHDNTDDEITHANFLNAYLASKGASTVDLEPFECCRAARRRVPVASCG